MRQHAFEALDVWSRAAPAADEQYGVWAYAVVFVLVLLSSAGVPFIGTLAVGGGCVLASQDHLHLTAVLIVSVLGGELGGIVGYQIGVRWGRSIMLRPGRTLERRERLLARGERLYAKWGRLAVFVTTAMVSGAAKMRFSQFVVWNLITTTGFVLAVGLSSYGAGRIVSGNHEIDDIGSLIFGLGVAAVLIWLGIVHLRRHRSRKNAADAR